MADSYDVVVVGAGGSGLAAAASAAERGAQVLLLEKQPEPGGTTGIAVGSYTAAVTALQRRAGIEDSVEAHAGDAGRFAPPGIEARNNDDLRRFFLGHAAETLQWLEGMGLRFRGPSPEPPNRVPRMHNVVPGARAYIVVLLARLRRCGGRLLCGAPAVALARDERSGRVTGVVAEVAGERRSFAARRGVVLAAGDYAGSSELIARFKGDRFAAVEGINPRSTGDGHLLAEGEGAQLVNMDVTYGPEIRFVAPEGRPLPQRLPASGPLAWLLGRLLPRVPGFVTAAVVRRLLVTWQHPEDALFDDGAILVNRQGRRFCDERVGPDRELAVVAQPGKACYIVLDERLSERYGAWPHFVSTAPRIAYAYVHDYLKLRPDVAVAGTIEAVAAARGLPPQALAGTVSEAGQERQGSDLEPLSGDRWVLLGPAKAYFTTTEGGVAIDARFRALDRRGQPIPGLYAIGQNGLGGQVLWGHGLHIAWAMTSGRLVGRQLAGGDT